VRRLILPYTIEMYKTIKMSVEGNKKEHKI